MIERIINHVEQSLDRLLYQYKGKPKIEGLLTSFVKQIQDIEDASFPLMSDRSVETSIGKQLDHVGDIVGIGRIAGQSDEEFREAIKTQIIQNMNEGTAEQVIAAAKFFLAAEAIWYLEVYPAEIDIFTSQTISPKDRTRIRANIEKFLPASVSLGSFGDFDADNPFIFNEGAGFGDVNDPEAGGLLADLYGGFTTPILSSEDGQDLLTEDGLFIIAE